MERAELVGVLGTLVLGSGCYTGLDADASGLADDAVTTSDGAETDGESGDTSQGPGEDPPIPPEAADRTGEAGLRRLTAAEYDNTLRDLIGDDQASGGLLLPEDPRTPYDNDYTLQVASQALVEGAELLAKDAADRLLADPARLDDIIGCTPAGPSDAACFESFLRTFGRRALRRPVADEDITAMMELLEIAEETGEFRDAAAAAVRAFLQHPRFLYRVEIGIGEVEGQPGVFELDDWEVATRLSYFLWGSTPNDWLLDTAEDGGLRSAEDVRDIAATMLDDPRARARITRFHALWMGYEALPFGGELAEAMQDETATLISTYLFEEERPWQDILRAEETFVSDALAEHYGLPGGGGWVDYADSGRQGLLSHGTFLSIGAKFDDTSPTQRGILVRTRLFCQDVPAPPDNVDADEPPAAEEADCKIDRYAIHNQAGCAVCHELIDPIGFGLENYGPLGRFRETEPGLPQCEIAGDGEVSGAGKFNGPKELADVVLETPELNACVATQLYRFAMGRYELTEYDEAFLEHLTETIGEGDFRFTDLIGEFVGTPEFRHRREETSGS